MEPVKAQWLAHFYGLYIVIHYWPDCALRVLGVTLLECGWEHNFTAMTWYY
jgi:hypothetical protein